jgi:hypothetical protein
MISTFRRTFATKMNTLETGKFIFPLESRLKAVQTLSYKLFVCDDLTQVFILLNILPQKVS